MWFAITAIGNHHYKFSSKSLISLLIITKICIFLYSFYSLSTSAYLIFQACDKDFLSKLHSESPPLSLCKFLYASFLTLTFWSTSKPYAYCDVFSYLLFSFGFLIFSLCCNTQNTIIKSLFLLLNWGFSFCS